MTFLRDACSMNNDKLNCINTLHSPMSWPQKFLQLLHPKKNTLGYNPVQCPVKFLDHLMQRFLRETGMKVVKSSSSNLKLTTIKEKHTQTIPQIRRLRSPLSDSLCCCREIQESFLTSFRAARECRIQVLGHAPTWQKTAVSVTKITISRDMDSSVWVITFCL